MSEGTITSTAQPAAPPPTTAPVTDRDRLDAYLEACRVRLRQRFLARGAAAISGSALLVTALFALLFVVLVPPAGWVVTARVVLYLALAAGISLLISRRFSSAAVARQVETHAPDFGGRLTTWRDATERGDRSPMLALLTRDAADTAHRHPPSDLIGTRSVAIPAGLALLGAAALLTLTTGTSPWQLAAQRLWTGDLFSAAAPRITVSPGDVVVPRGADVVVEAQALGFVATRMEMHASFEGTDGWETAPMSRLGDDRYGFVFVGVTEQVAYYVGAQRLNSERHLIHVAELPRVTDVTLAYTYPDWTNLPATERYDGDVTALAGTRVSISATTDAPVEDPLIVVNGEVLDAEADGLVSSGSFTVSEPGSWHVAMRHEGTLARISDTYYIDVVEDQAPEVAYGWPGHDKQATAIEELTLRFTAEDDFGVASLTFNYSVNGGGWIEVPLNLSAATSDDSEGAEQLLMLEDVEVASPAGGEPRPLRPGDMISFYAEARDHTMTTRTALYFIDIRPFDRTYRESQAMGGQGNGQGDNLEIAERQREILSATWNLINKQQSSRGREAADADQAETLALLQRTLKDQVQTLVQRAGARRLTLDEEIDTFARELELAAESMEPAAERLAALSLEDAVEPEQQALQHLLAAEATMSDVDVSMARAEMRGTNSGQSLSELMDLEMDPERNRYEMPQNPNMGEGPEQQDDEWQRLEELAKRQQQLAERQANNDESLASRWQQERLQRELEQLREQLEAERNQQNQQGGQGSQQLENAIAELNQAREAIDRSMDRREGDPNATREATEAMRRAAEQLKQNAIGEMDQRLAHANRQVENLLNDQRGIMNRLEELQAEELASSRSGLQRPMNNYAMEPYAERKKRMQEDLNELAGEIGELADDMPGTDTERTLDRALSELADERVEERLAASAGAFEYGRPLFAIPNEEAVQDALERLSSRLDQARRQLARSQAEASDTSPLGRVRTLRQELARLSPNGGAGAWDDAQIESLIRQADMLENRLGVEMGEGFDLDTTPFRLAYQERGTDAANTEQLAQLTRDRLDLIEAALLNIESVPIRAQQPRDSARDSEGVARYFRDLSAPDDTER